MIVSFDLKLGSCPYEIIVMETRVYKREVKLILQLLCYLGSSFILNKVQKKEHKV